MVPVATTSSIGGRPFGGTAGGEVSGRTTTAETSDTPPTVRPATTASGSAIGGRGSGGSGGSSQHRQCVAHERDTQVVDPLAGRLHRQRARFPRVVVGQPCILAVGPFNDPI